MSFSRRRILGTRGGSTVLPFEAVGVVTGGWVGTEFGISRVAKCDDELIPGVEFASHSVDYTTLDYGACQRCS